MRLTSLLPMLLLALLGSGQSLSAPSMSRRAAAMCGLTAAVAPSAAHASADPPRDPPLASGVVRIADGVTPPEAQALYVTVRLVPNQNQGLFVTAGKVPPLAAARFPGPLTFPYKFELRTDDLTPEWSSTPASEWQTRDLIVSARLDTDGVAATRQPEDLVGRSEIRKAGAQSGWTGADVELQGRGLTGRVLTGGSLK